MWQIISNTFLILLLTGNIVGGGYMIYARRDLAKAARKKAERWAANRDWRYVEQDPELAKHWDLPLFRRGDQPSATNILTGSVASVSGAVRQVLSFDYEYTVTAGRSVTTYRNHVVAVFLPGRVPTLSIEPENLSARVGKTLGGQDIQFESQNFNRKWRIMGDNLPFAHAVVHPRTMEFLMAHVQPKAMGYFLVDNVLLTYLETTQAVDRIDELAGTLCALADLIPNHVWQDYANE